MELHAPLALLALATLVLIAVTCIVAFQATGTSLRAVYEYWSGAVVLALQT